MKYFLITNNFNRCFAVVAENKKEAILTAVEVIQERYENFGEIKNVQPLEMYHKNFKK